MDVHNLLRAATPEAIAAAKQREAEVQGKYGVNYLRYWLDPTTGHMFCLVEAPDRESAVRVHREAHGAIANEIYEVIEGTVATSEGTAQ
jgi:hypothetical protein